MKMLKHLHSQTTGNYPQGVTAPQQASGLLRSAIGGMPPMERGFGGNF